MVNFFTLFSVIFQTFLQMQKWIMMSIHSWETDIEFLSFHLSKRKEGMVNGPLLLSKLSRLWTFKHSLIAIIYHAFCDKTIIILVLSSRISWAAKIKNFLELWKAGNKRNVAFIFERKIHAQNWRNVWILAPKILRKEFENVFVVKLKFEPHYPLLCWHSRLPTAWTSRKVIEDEVLCRYGHKNCQHKSFFPATFF